MNATLLCLALLVPGYGEKDIVERIEDAGGAVGTFANGGLWIFMPVLATDADLGDLCEVRHLVVLNLGGQESNQQGLADGVCPARAERIEPSLCSLHGRGTAPPRVNEKPSTVEPAV
jgi:hypothetical protein